MEDSLIPRSGLGRGISSSRRSLDQGGRTQREIVVGKVGIRGCSTHKCHGLYCLPSHGAAAASSSSASAPCSRGLFPRFHPCRALGSPLPHLASPSEATPLGSIGTNADPSDVAASNGPNANAIFCCGWLTKLGNGSRAVESLLARLILRTALLWPVTVLCEP